MIIGMDIGYGYTKVYTEQSGEVVQRAFPSVIGNVENIRFHNTLIGQGDGPTVTYDGRQFWYGEMALLQSRVKNTLLDRSRVSDSHARLLFIAGLVDLSQVIPDMLPTIPLRVVTGLPVAFYSDRATVQEQMLGERGYHHVEINRATYHFHIEKVVVIPQPFGALFSAILDERGQIRNEQLAGQSVGVIDVGTYTTDLVVMRPDDQGRPTYIERESDSVSLGLSKVLERTKRSIADQFGLEMSLHETDKALRSGKFMVRDEEHSTLDIARPYLKEVAATVMATAKEKWGEGLALNRILVTGGGGELFHKEIEAFYPHAELLAAPFWANVRGFYRYGQRVRTWQLR